MRKLMCALAAFGVMAWIGAAWAIVGETTITLANTQGEPIPEAKISLKRVDKKPAPRPKTPTTNQKGEVTLTHEEEDKKSKALVIFTVTTKDGKTETIRTTLQDVLTSGKVTLTGRAAETPRTERVARPISRVDNTSAGKISSIAPITDEVYALGVITEMGWAHHSSSYGSTGMQLPAGFGSNSAGFEICGQGKVKLWELQAAQVFVGLNGCYDTAGTSTLFSYKVHPGANGFVTATIDPGASFEPFVEWRQRMGIGYGWGSVGFVEKNFKLDITSNQTDAGGKIESASNSIWDPGVMLRAGYSMPWCTNCIFGQPLIGSIGGNFAWFPSSQSVSITSSAFGFTENATLNHTTQYSVDLKLTVPFGDRNPRDILP